MARIDGPNILSKSATLEKKFREIKCFCEDGIWAMKNGKIKH